MRNFDEDGIHVLKKFEEKRLLKEIYQSVSISDGRTFNFIWFEESVVTYSYIVL